MLKKVEHEKSFITSGPDKKYKSIWWVFYDTDPLPMDNDIFT